MTVKEYHSPVAFFFSRGYMVHPGSDSPSTSVVCSTYCEAPAKVIRWQPNISLHKRLLTFSHFSGKASAGAPDTRDDEAPPEKCKKSISIYLEL